ncbi:hypothetical protein SNL152K_8664 [Streptomyces sp. NL15-2K]|nr:hypothetical protein SNL152K_8664 [Streptomyces sp. NL15-2K]
MEGGHDVPLRAHRHGRRPTGPVTTGRAGCGRRGCRPHPRG